MTVWLCGFFRCDCGKIHAFAHVSVISICKCGRNLQNVMHKYIRG